ncbi:MAG: flagellar hook protein FlgE [Alphaproteobacteria bacterium]|nr:flagellar hook protein FlgE [Alphaproteobacteria bacterium]
MGSLFAALGVSVAGLSAQSEAIGNISDNLSNSQTTGFKAIGTAFNDLVTASSATNNSPGGVTATPSYQNDVQGTITSTTTTTNLAISGGGFFPVETAVQTASGATQLTGDQYYTRAGDFTLNSDGYMVNSAGYYLEGYSVDSSTGVVNSSSLSAVQVSSLLDNPVATTTVNYAANLPAGATAGTFTSSASTVNVYDALGNTHAMSLTWTKTGTNQWSVQVSVADGLGTGTPYTATVPVTFGTNGEIETGGIAADTASGASGTYAVDSGSTEAGVNFNLSFPGAAAQTIDLNLGNYNAATGITQYASSGSSTDVSVSSITQNGLGEGSYSSLSIDSSGIVSINYTNGTVRQIYQIPIATFNSPDSLQRVSGSAYQATLASGTANLHTAGSYGAGTITSSSLESSTVDISTEFTDMIQSQQVYAANAKVVTTVNQMLQTIIQAV